MRKDLMLDPEKFNNNENENGLLPICSPCKRIRDDSGYWKQIEACSKEHSDAAFTHGICPEFVKRLYPGLGMDDEH